MFWLSRWKYSGEPGAGPAACAAAVPKPIATVQATVAPIVDLRMVPPLVPLRTTRRMLAKRRREIKTQPGRVSNGRSGPNGPGPALASPAMRLIICRCEVRYSGRLSTVLPMALRLLMIKADGAVMVHADAGGYKPLNWMTPPTVVEETAEGLVVRRVKGEDRLEIRIDEVVSDVEHDMGGPAEAVALEKDGVEAHLQELLAAAPEWCGEGFRLVRREWPTDIGPVDLMCRDGADGWVAVEIKRIGTIDAVEQLTRYLERIQVDPALADCRGVLAAQAIKPQARTLAEARGIACVEVDLEILRGEREPDLTLFA